MRLSYIFGLLFICFLNIAWIWQKPKDVEYMQKGYQAWEAGNLSEAITDFETVLTVKPANIEALNFLGVIYEELGFPDKAEEKYLTVLKIKNNYLPAYLNLGLLYSNKGDTEKAIYYLQRRIDRGNSQDPWTLKAKKALLGIKMNLKKEQMKAPLDANNIIMERQTSRSPQVKLAQKPDTKRLKLIDQELDKINFQSAQAQVKIQESPKTVQFQMQEKKDQEAQAIFNQGQKLASQNKFQEAIEAYDRALKTTPGNPQIIKARMDAFIQWKQQAINE